MTRARPAVIGHIQGGLGNQLFCYAAARALALRSSLPLRLNTRAGYRGEKYGRDCLLAHFSLDFHEAGHWEGYNGPLGRARRSRRAKRDTARPLDQRGVIKEPGGQAYLEGLVGLKPRQTVYLLGYWQDEAYFADAAPTLRQEMQLRGHAPYRPDPHVASLADQPNTVSVHCRSYREVANPPPGLVLDASYYTAALEAVTRALPEAQLLVFSDDRAYAQTVLDQTGHADRITYAPTIDADATTATLTDFALMARCRHHVVGNSSFSWWAAWLGEREGSFIIAPPTGLAGSPGGFPDRWLH